MKKLTVRYSFTQVFYWMAHSGGGSFATMFLLNKGMPSGIVGLLLALAGLLSALTQPVIAAVVDRSLKHILVRNLSVMSALCCTCYALQFFSGTPLLVSGVLYGVAIWSGGAMASLVNAVSVAYDREGYAINYGIARGIGAGASAVSALILGIMLEKLGNAWMLIYLMTAWGCS